MSVYNCYTWWFLKSCYSLVWISLNLFYIQVRVALERRIFLKNAEAVVQRRIIWSDLTHEMKIEFLMFKILFGHVIVLYSYMYNCTCIWMYNCTYIWMCNWLVVYGNFLVILNWICKLSLEKRYDSDLNRVVTLFINVYKWRDKASQKVYCDTCKCH